MQKSLHICQVFLNRPREWHNRWFTYSVVSQSTSLKRVLERKSLLKYVFVSIDSTSESTLPRFSYYYVPRDEAFEDLKKESYVAGTLKVIMHELLPQIEAALTKENEFHCFTDIDRLYKENMVIKEQQPDALSKVLGFLSNLNLYKQIPRFLETLEDSTNLRFATPQSYESMY